MFGRATTTLGIGPHSSFFSVGLPVCLFVMHLKDGDSACDFAMMLLEYRNGFDIVDRGRFAVVHPGGSTLSACFQLATSQNAVTRKPVKFGIFFAARGRQNILVETKFVV